jgi:hypothetical protein
MSTRSRANPWFRLPSPANARPAWSSYGGAGQAIEQALIKAGRLEPLPPSPYLTSKERWYLRTLEEIPRMTHRQWVDQYLHRWPDIYGSSS